MKPHECLAMGRGGMKNLSIIWMIIYQVHSATLSKPWNIVTCCHFYVEFSKYIWSFGTSVILLKSMCLTLQSHQDVYKMSELTELLSLLKHIRSCQYLPNINTVEEMDELQKLNTDLIAISDKYFSTNIWIPDSLEN